VDIDGKVNYYAVIPANIRYNNELKFAERLLYGEITALSTKEGYCFASNRYFAELYKVSISTISRWISHLEELGYIHVELVKTDSNEIVERRLYIVDNTYTQKDQYPYVQKSQYPICKKSKDNNININKIERIYNNIINDRAKMSDKLFLKAKSILEKFEMNYSKEILDSFSQENLERIKIISYALIELTIKNKSLKRISRERLFVIYDKCKKANTEIVSFYDYYLISVLNELYKP